MIRMYGHVPAWGIPDISPYVTKIDCYLRMAGLPYELVRGDLGKAPQGKLPYIEDGGITVADSSFILAYLKTTYGDPLDGELTPEQETIAFLFWRLMDESFYWCLVQARYRRDADFKLYDPLWAEFFADFAPDERRAAIQAARDRLLLEFYQSGRGRHSEAEVEHLACREIDAIATYLADKAYLFGPRPSSADAAVHGFLQNLIYVPFENGVKSYAIARPNIAAYMERIAAQYYPELSAARRQYCHG